MEQIEFEFIYKVTVADETETLEGIRNNLVHHGLESDNDEDADLHVLLVVLLDINLVDIFVLELETEEVLEIEQLEEYEGEHDDIDALVDVDGETVLAGRHRDEDAAVLADHGTHVQDEEQVQQEETAQSECQVAAALASREGNHVVDGQNVETEHGDGLGNE